MVPRGTPGTAEKERERAKHKEGSPGSTVIEKEHEVEVLIGVCALFQHFLGRHRNRYALVHEAFLCLGIDYLKTKRLISVREGAGDRAGGGGGGGAAPTTTGLQYGSVGDFRE